MVKLVCAADSVRVLGPQAVRQMLDGDASGELLLLDVRQPEEYEAGHLPGAKLIPLGELEARQAELDRGKKIITYCRSGHRSMAAAMTLCNQGFSQIHTLDGGILNWSHETIAGMPERRPDLLTETADVRDLLLLSLRLEKGSREFYLAAADGVEEAGPRKLFLDLADTEYGHMKRLYQRLKSLPGQELIQTLDHLLGEREPGYMEGGIEVHPAIATFEKDFVDEMSALELAIEKEYAAYDFYKRAAALVDSPDSRALLDELALGERDHANRLLERVAQLAAGRPKGGTR